MKSFSRLRHAPGVIMGFCLSALFGLSSVLALERLFTPDETVFSYALRCWPLLFCFAAGRLRAVCFKAGGRALSFAGTVLPVAAVALYGVPAGFSEWTRFALTLVPAAVMCCVGFACIPTYPSGPAVASVVLFLFDIALLAITRGEDAVPALLNATAAADFLLCLLAANRKGLHDGAHGSDSRVLRGMRWKNTLLLLGFAAVAAAIAATGLPLRLLAAAVALLWRGLSAAWAFIRGLFSFSIPESSPPESSGEQELFASDVVQVGAWKYLVYVFALAVVIFLAVQLIKLLRSRTKREKKPKKRRSRRRPLAENEAGDEIESIFDLSALLARGRNGLYGLFGRLRREPGFADMMTDAERVRFAFREFLRLRIRRDSPDGHASAKTPLELAAAEDSPAIKTLAADYSALRYGGLDPGPEGGKNAAASRNELRKIDRKR